MPTYNDYGIVLSSYNLAESDKILNIYTKESGLVRAIAKGVKKLNSRFSGKVEPLSCCYFQFAKGKNLDIISDCSQINSFALLRTDLFRLTYGILFLEIVDNFAHEMESESIHIYDLLYSGLEQLQKINNLDLFSIKFIVDFLSVHGLSPQLETCVSCSAKISFNDTDEKYPYSGALGGLLCRNCSGFIDYKAVNYNVLKILEQYLYVYSNSKNNSQSSLQSKESTNLTLGLLIEHINFRAKNKIKTFDLVASL